MNPLVIIIFGSTGDLATRKLLPAVAKLHAQHQIPDDVCIVALGRRDFDTAAYWRHVISHTQQPGDIESIKSHVVYRQIDLETCNDYDALGAWLDDHVDKHATRLFYLALDPGLFPVVARHLNASRLVEQGNVSHAVVFEKPFGHDLASARSVNQLLWTFFDEQQIYRIDHYLGKEMIQNIMMVRFANRIFEEIWHNRGIKSVKIIAKETEGVLGRGGYYDASGALRDMVQSHLLQMLSLIAMDVPLSYRSEDVKNEKVKVLEKLSFDKHALLVGQYEGYTSEANIPDTSRTETFVFLKTFVNTPRFKGVPFYLMTGKKLDEKASLITIEFEETNEQRKWNLPLSTNKLHIKIAPEDGVGLVLNSKVPGLRDNVEQVELEYCIACHAVGNMSEAYEKLLLDIYEGHKTLFTRWDEIETAWSFIDKVGQHQDKPMVYRTYDELRQAIMALTDEEM
ncbi:MAG: glucose-6-phosphate dehydrogenase [Acholeplasmataceae bacterium]|nr:MAG: glucose-6-phosphate dehydrogenase [Acholeplasmataceae bacterium]